MKDILINHQTPLTIISNSQKANGGLPSGMTYYNARHTWTTGYHLGYAYYHQSSHQSYLGYLKAVTNPTSLLDSLQQVLDYWMKEKNYNPIVFIFLIHQLKTVDWYIDHSVVEQLKVLGAGAELEDLNQKITYGGSTEDFSISYCLASLFTFKSKSDMGLHVSSAFESADMGANSQAGLSLNFNVAAGASNTVFDVSSGLAPANLATATGIASAAVTLTDTLGDGATLAPDGASAYSALYNGQPGSLFAGLLNNSITAGAFQTVTSEGSFGSAAIAGPVVDISSRWTFAVSAFDVAAGTSVFTVVPAPGSIALLGLAGLAIRRRR